ncbi:hypothetical protein [Mangrovibacillus cuniculi]|uniref:Uncharacterized protein n=1 Tax=Mangrovibacillus cuniculi TaxID=2593652 RepID=A0A7S8HGB5_9BACI|nr:hypothetical protein [Mangrovibacillus cuniculi]QPC47632.1 hypothetical protein G8O30_12050 [Mangrovibacillus cuniculi]
MSLVLGKDEIINKSQNFTTNLALFWLKTDLSLTNKRVIGYQPNTLLGVIPLGRNEVSFPLKNIASVSVSTKLHFVRLLVGLFFVFSALGSIGNSFLGALLFLAIGLIPLLNSFTSKMTITNNAGQPVSMEISILEKDKVQNFVNDVNISISEVA